MALLNNVKSSHPTTKTKPSHENGVDDVDASNIDCEDDNDDVKLVLKIVGSIPLMVRSMTMMMVVAPMSSWAAAAQCNILT